MNMVTTCMNMCGAGHTDRSKTGLTVIWSKHWRWRWRRRGRLVIEDGAVRIVRIEGTMRIEGAVWVVRVVDVERAVWIVRVARVVHAMRMMRMATVVRADRDAVNGDNRYAAVRARSLAELQHVYPSKMSVQQLLPLCKHALA